jgi:hypothetical protein
VTELADTIVRLRLVDTIRTMKLIIRIETTSIAKVVVICSTIALVACAVAEAFSSVH